jgi:NADPH:quinone reductase-like Zn-dependent oxidoreductase
MRALRFHDYGGPEVLTFDDVPVPTPGEGEILVKVAGSGINPIDWKVREGANRAYFPATFPQIISREFSGTVAGLGAGVSDFAVGDEVYGISPLGSCAEYTLAKAAETGLKPPSMDLADAAAVPLAGMTAWQAIFDFGGLERGQKALIHAGAGGVGSFAIQMAKWKGAYVYSTASGGNLHLLQELGADEPIDYTTARFEDVAKDVDFVLETIGGAQMLRSLATLKTGGILVSVTGPAPEEEATKEGKRVAQMRMRANREDLEEIAALIQDLVIRPVISAVVPFDEAVEAFKESQSGHVRGKLVVRIS